MLTPYPQQSTALLAKHYCGVWWGHSEGTVMGSAGQPEQLSGASDVPTSMGCVGVGVGQTIL